MSPPTPSRKPDPFDAAVTFALRHEGGYAHHPEDPGGETNWGISKRSYPELDIRRLTRGEAMAIYRRDFWDALLCPRLPEPLGFVLFDSAVNCGPKRAVRWLQQACGAPGDGVMGPVTLERARLDPRRFAAGLLRRRMAHYRAQDNWPSFGRGWTNRVRELAMTAGLPDPT